MGEENKSAGSAGATTVDVGALVKEAVAATVKELVPGLTAAVAEANKGVLAEIQKSIATSAAAPAAEGGDKKPAAAAGLTEADVKALLKKEREAGAAEEARKGYLAGKMKDLPEVYHGRLGGDPAKWKEEEQAIRDQFRKDFAAAGGKPPAVGADAPGGEKPAAAVDYSKLSPTQLISLGLKSSTPQRGTAAPVAPATPPATTTTATAAAAAAAK